MTRIVLPAMSEKKTGAIINVSSASGLKPTPMLSLYSATKVYIEFCLIESRTFWVKSFISDQKEDNDCIFYFILNNICC